MKKLKKLVIPTIASILVVVVILRFFTRPVEATWYDDSFTYRQKVSFTHNAALGGGRQVTLTIDTATLITNGKMQSDCDDSRFTDGSGGVLLYKLTGTCNNASTTYVVVYPTVTNGANVSYFYYGNPQAASGSTNVLPGTSLTPSGAITFSSEEKGPSPALYWKFDEGYGTTANDSSLNQNNGSLTSASVPITDVEQQINIIDQEYTTTGTTDAPTDNSLGLVLWDGSKYNSETVYFEALIKCTTCSGGNTAAQATLYSSAGAAVTGATASTTNSSYTLIRSSAITGNLSDSTKYTIRLKVDATSGTAAVKAARLIVVQSDATSGITNTVNQIELGNAQVIASTSYGELTDPKYYYYDSTQFAGTQTAYFESTLKGDAGAAAQGNGRIWSSGFEVNSITAGMEWDFVGSSGTPSVQGTTVRTGSYALQISSLSSGTRKALGHLYESAQSNVRYYRVYFRVDTLPSAENRIISVNSSSTLGTGMRAYITVDNTGALRLYDEDGSIGSASSALSTSTWYRIEIQVDGSGAGATDTVNARLDGTQFAGSTTRDLSSGYLALQVGGNLNAEAQTTGNWYFDDVAINNGTGGFPGSGKIISLRPNATGDNGDWANDYTNLDETPPPNDATDYIESHAANQIEDVNLDDTPGDMASGDRINNVAVNVRATSDTAANNARFLTRIKAAASGTTEESSVLLNNTTTWYTNVSGGGAKVPTQTLYDLPGASTTSWTKSDLDTAQLGVKLTTSNNTQQAWVSQLWLTVDYTPAEELEISAKVKLQQCDEASCSWTDVTSSEITTTSTTYTNIRTSALTLTSARRYRVAVAKSANTGTVNISNAKLIIEQTHADGLTGIELIHEHINTLATDTDSTYTSQLFQNTFTPANLSTTISYFEATLKTSAGTGYAQAYNNTAAAAISSSEVSTASTSYTRVRSSSLTMPVSASELDTQVKNSATNTTSVGSSWFVIHLSGTSTGTLPVWRPENYCVRGYCILFTGDIVSKPYSAAQNIEPGTGSFTVTGWFRHSVNLSGTDTLLGRYRSGGYKIYTSSSGLCFGIDDDGSSFPSDSACTATTYADSTWHYLTAIKNGTSSISLYVDGVRVGIDSSITSSSVSGSSPVFVVGSENTRGTNPWDGFIDEVKYYNFALTDTQIVSNFAGPGTPKGVSASIEPNQKLLSNGLTGYWRLDETSGNASDSSGNGLTLTNNGTTTYVLGKYANGSEHVPASSQYLSTATTINSVKSVSFWTNPDSNTNYYLSLTSGAYVTSSSGTVSATGFTNPKIYVNGQESSTIAQDLWQLVTVTSETAINANQVYVGRVGSDYFDGTMDEVRLYNRTLSSSEAAGLYNWSPGTVGYWKLDEMSGTTANDSSTNSITTSTFSGNTTWTTGKYGGGLTFDGTDDYVPVTESSPIDLGATTDSYTLSGWAKTATDYSGTATLIAKDDGSGAYPFALYLNSSEQACFQISDGTNNPSVCGSTALNDGSWHHLTGVRDVAADKVLIYVDSILINSATDSTTATTANNDNVTFGNSGSSYTANDWNGDLDGLRIYNYALDTRQITVALNADHPVPGSPVGSAAIYYNLDEQTGNTINNSGSQTSVSGTNSGAAWLMSNSCKYYGCLNFDTSTDNVSIGDTLFTDSLTAFTVSIWVNPQTLATSKAIVSKSDFSTQTSFGIVTDASNSDEVRVYIASSTSDTSNYLTTTNLDLATSSWQHLTLVYDGTLSASERIKVYKNGLLKSGSITGTIPSSLTSGSTSNFKIGASDSGSFTTLISYLDDFRFFNSALSADQAKILVNADSAVNFSVGFREEDQILGGGGNAPVGRWKFDENTGVSTFDTSGNNFTGTLTSGPTWTEGINGSALRFSGGSYVSVGTGPTTVKSIELWIQPDSNTGEYAVTLNGSTYLWVTAGKLACVGCPSGVGTTIYVGGGLENSIIANSWAHVVLLDPIGINVSALEFGRVNGVGNFNGKIDHIAMYDYVRTPTQINYSANRQAPMYWWKFDECSGPSAFNSASGFQGTGTLNPGASGNTTVGACGSGTSTQMWNNGTTGKFNSALDFDGTDDYVSIGDTNNFDILNGMDMTMEAWFYRDTFTTDDVILAKVNDIGTASEQGFSMFITSADTVNCRYADGTDSVTVTSNTTITATGWHHVVCVYDDDSNTNTQIYIDGKPDRSGTPSVASVDGMSKADGEAIGAEIDGGNPFDGLIDHVKIYRTALSASQAIRAYNQGASVRFGPLTGSP